jgi:glycosyltransferase involved in cell wall biosynthesis
VFAKLPPLPPTASRSADNQTASATDIGRNHLAVPVPQDLDAEPHAEIVFNEDRDLITAHEDATMSSVLHIFDRHWHGIRSATACLPGGKLGISHKNAPTPDEIRHIEGLIFKHGFKTVCFQGYSEAADYLAEFLHRDFGSDLRLYVVTHVTTSQFEHAFEMAMLKRVYDKVGRGIIARAGSVKPNFHLFHEKTWPGCVINIPPALSRMVVALPKRESGTVFIPVENTWRKNLYTQVAAAQRSPKVGRVVLVNWPAHLDQLVTLNKIQVVGFQPREGLLAYMALAQLVTNVSFAECQPMTQLEALAVGTPALVGPLRLPGFSDHPLSKLCEVTELDDPGLLSRRMETVLDAWRTDSRGLVEMISDFVGQRVAAGLASYKEFLEL